MNKTLGKGLRLHIVPVQTAFGLILALLLVACGDATTAAPAATTAPATGAASTGAPTTAAATTGATTTTSSAMTAANGAISGAAATTAAPTTALAGSTTSAATSTGSGTAQGWKEFDSDEGKFSILMPVPPERKVQTQNTSTGDDDTIVFVGTPPGVKVSYIASYLDLPEATIKKYDTNTILQETITSQATKAGGVSQDEKAITLGAVPGRQGSYKITLSEGEVGITITHVYLTGNRLYQLAVFYVEPDKPTDSDISAFFDSFKITA